MARRNSNNEDTGRGKTRLPLHPALEAFASTLAEILVDRHRERKATKQKEDGEATEGIPGDFDREDCHE